VLEFHHLSHRFRARREPGGYKHALADVDFLAVPGKITGLLGPNGAGKTTAMKLVFGLLPVQTGTITWAGEAIGLPHRRRFGYMPESRSLYPGMRVADQLVYFARHHGLSRKDAALVVNEWLERLGMTGFARRRLGSLSLGEQQRVQLVGAFSHSPTLAVLDEPFSGLDLMAVDIVGDTLRAAAAQGTAVVISSHQLDVVEDLCDAVTILNRGRVALTGDVQELREGFGPTRLRLVLEPHSAGWVAGVPGVHLIGHDSTGLLLTLEPGVDPGVVLAAAQAAGRLRDVQLGLPSLSELFRSAVAVA
jgi:ABC-2 type transport system ATP-binding protein